jgi:hypothetical protein
LDKGKYALNARTPAGKNGEDKLEIKNKRRVVGKKIKVN